LSSTVILLSVRVPNFYLISVEWGTRKTPTCNQKSTTYRASTFR